MYWIAAILVWKVTSDCTHCFDEVMQPASAVVLLPQHHFCFRLPACMRGLAPVALALLLPHPVLPLAWQLGAAHAPVHKLSNLHCLCCFSPCPIISPRLQRSHCRCLGTLLQARPITDSCESGRSCMKPAHDTASTWLLVQVDMHCCRLKPHHII